MTTSVWSEVTYLACEDIKKPQFNTSLAVDTDTTTVTISGGDVKYKEYGNTIEFVSEYGNQSFVYSLDRVAGTLQRLTFDENDNLSFIANYKCTRTDPLF